MVDSLVLDHNAMPRVVLTTLYIDLISDEHLLTAGLFENPQMNGRVAGVVMLFAERGYLEVFW